MSPGKITQIAFASRDIGASMAHFSQNLGIAPWFVLPRSRLPMRYRSSPSNPELIVAFANCNGMEFEIMQQVSHEPSIWQDFMRGCPERERFHHSCLRTDDYSGMVGQLSDAGYEIACEGETTRGRFAYFEHSDHPGSYLELLEQTPSREAMFAHVLAEGRDWDGRGPIRPMPQI